MLFVRDVLVRKGSQIHTARPEDTVFEAVVNMEEHRVGCVVVLDDDGRACGMITERDFLRQLAVKELSARESNVGEIMSSPVVCARPDDTVQHCLEVMTAKRFRHMPVADDERRIVGVVSIGDLVKEIISEQRMDIDQLENYIQGKYPG